jgi:hypothetical protein
MFAHFLFTPGANTSQTQLGKLETCGLCGMAYIQDNEEDRRRHDTHCKVCTVSSRPDMIAPTPAVAIVEQVHPLLDFLVVASLRSPSSSSPSTPPRSPWRAKARTRARANGPISVSPKTASSVPRPLSVSARCGRGPIIAGGARSSLWSSWQGRRPSLGWSCRGRTSPSLSRQRRASGSLPGMVTGHEAPGLVGCTATDRLDNRDQSTSYLGPGAVSRETAQTI